MSNRRYHFHVACVADDVSISSAQDALSVFFEDRAFFTKDLLIHNDNSANYSRRCVNDCDAVIVLVGHRYGQVNQSGVSQLHLTYINTKTKNKPMMVLINTDLCVPERDHHLTDFIKTIESQHTFVWYFNTHSKLPTLLNDALTKLALAEPTWQQSTPALIDPPQSTNKPSAQTDSLDEELFRSILPTHKVNLDLNTAKVATPMLDDEFLVDCSAHAFQGGTLLEVPFVLTFSWRKVLKALLALNSPFTSQTLTKTLGEIIDKDHADKLIIQQHPKAHAISRHQLKKTSVAWVKEQLHLAGWIAPINQNQWIVNDAIKTNL